MTAGLQRTYSRSTGNPLRILQGTYKNPTASPQGIYSKPTKGIHACKQLTVGRAQTYTATYKETYRKPASKPTRKPAGPLGSFYGSDSRPTGNLQ